MNFPDMADFSQLALQCGSSVNPQTLRALAHIESSFNPFAIAVVNGRLDSQPKSLAEAVAAVERLERGGKNYSVGYMQVNKHNFKKYGLTVQKAFDGCTNIRTGSKILEACYVSASKTERNSQVALRKALSCYYSGNFIRGFQPENGKLSYVDKVVGRALGPEVSKGLPPTRTQKNGPLWATPDFLATKRYQN